MTFVRVCSVNDVKPGHGKVVDADGIEIAVFNQDGHFYAIDNACPHRRGPLGEGMLDGDVVTCPHHGWQFDIKTGKGVMMPVSVKTFPVKTEGHDVMVDV